MSATDKAERHITKLEMAHVLFMDIVGYSKLPMDYQKAVLHTLQAVVPATPEFLRAQASQELVTLPTGDGMALVFFEDAEAAARCALEICRALKSHPEILLRMGLHSGPVYRVADINANQGVAGGGINVAQRVMDCGDAGHILASRSVADVLGQVSIWEDCLHDLGEAEVKHGHRVHLYNVYTKDVGNAELPQKLRPVRPMAPTILSEGKRSKLVLGVLAAAATALIFVGISTLFPRRVLTNNDTIVLADFANTTGDAVFDGTLKQGLSIELEQSPFLNIISDQQILQTLQMMGQKPDAKLTPQIARELCQRAGSAAVIDGSIAQIGTPYLLTLEAVNCATGKSLASTEAQASDKNHVLEALGKAASVIRNKLGESLRTVQKFDTPLEQATTPSLQALKEYSLGHYLRAIELDPGFATAYKAFGDFHDGFGEPRRATEYYKKAFELRDRASERERLAIEASYYTHVTGQLDKAQQASQIEVESYPREANGYEGLSGAYAYQGQFEKAADAARQAISLAPDRESLYENLASQVQSLQRLDEARQILRDAQARNPNDGAIHEDLYGQAFITSNTEEMAKEIQWLTAKRLFENAGLELAADTEAYAGHLGKARELTGRAVDSAIRVGNTESAGVWQELGAQREAVFGYQTKARQAAERGLKFDPTSLAVDAEAAIAFAMAGDTARAEFQAQDLSKRFPLNTQIQSIWLPAIHAQALLNRKNPALALRVLQAPSAIEIADIQFVTNASCAYTLYVRAEAYLASENGKAAASEFQRILDHSGTVWNCWTASLAHLGLARAYAMALKSAQGADADATRARARTAYQDFLTLWKDADPDIPIYRQAKAEYAKLQ